MDCKVGNGSTRAERLPVPRVASETSAIASPHHGSGPRRPAGAEAKQQSTPFALLLDDTGGTAPPSPRDQRERARPSSAAESASDTRPDPRVRGRQENRQENADDGNRTESAEAQQPTPDANPEEDSDLKEVNAVEALDGEDEPAEPVAIESALLAAATDAPAEQQTDVSEQAAAPAMPVATPALPATGAANADATDVAAAMDVAIEAAGARSAQVPGTNSGTNGGSDIGSEKGAKNGADIGAGEAASGEAAAAEAGAADATGRKAGSSAANGPDTFDASKAAHAKPSARAESAAPAGTETPVRDGQGDAEAFSQAGPDATGKSEHAGAESGRSALQNTTQKPDEASSRPHADAHAGAHAGAAADSGKPPVDIAQLASLHPADRFANVAPTAAQAAATGSTPVPIAGLAIEIAARAQAGGTRFEIRLDPPELGRIDVRLDVDRSGQVTTRLVVEKAETLDFLRRDAPELERALQQAGLKTGDNGLQFALRDQTAGGQNQDSGENWRSNAAKLVVPDPEMTAVETAAAGYGRSLRLGTGIDIRV
jgi:flagellar hook-length control protein FliK